MTKVYFVRHSKPDFSVKEDSIRPLTKEGLKECKKVTEALIDKSIHKVYSSPYKRAIDTVKDLAENLSLGIETKEDFRERAVTNGWIEDFKEYSKTQWRDFSYKLPEGESLGEVQIRNINTLNKLLIDNEGKNIVIGTHGTALSTIINFYNKNFGYEDFWRIIDIMPWIVEMEFQGKDFLSMREINI